MTDIPNPPAFSRSAEFGSNGDYDYGDEGMTLRDYFAAYAPTEIPKWFKHSPPPDKQLTLPFTVGVTDDQKKLIEEWLEHPYTFQLPPNLGYW